MKNKQAFTLIELLVVVLVIGILAAVALPQYQVAVTKSRYATLKNLTHSIAQAQEIYYLANGKYATDFEELSVEMPAGKKDTSTATSYQYDWGDCSLTEIFVWCRNTQIGMMYRISPVNATYQNQLYNGRGARSCTAFNTDLNSTQNRICKQETGRTTTAGGDGVTYISWTYQ